MEVLSFIADLGQRCKAGTDPEIDMPEKTVLGKMRAKERLSE